MAEILTHLNQILTYLKDDAPGDGIAFLESESWPMRSTVELDAQYRQLREECGLLDRSERGKLLVSGPDAAEYLQGQLTNDVEALEPGEGQYAALLDRKGHMQADMRVLRLARRRRSGSTPRRRRWRPRRRHLEMYKIGREVEVADVSAERAILSLIGPRSAEVAGTAALPENACEATDRRRGRVPRRRHRATAST